MRRFWLSLALLAVGCAGTIPPPIITPPPPTPIRLVQVTVRGATGSAPANATVALRLEQDGFRPLPCPLTGSRAVCELDARFPRGEAGAHVLVDAPDYDPRDVRVLLTGRSQDLEDVALALTFTPLPRLVTNGRAWFTADGQPFDGPASTEFNLLARFLREGPDAVEPVMAQLEAEGYRYWRVFTAFDICPAKGPGCSQPIGRLIPREHPDLYARIPAFSRLAARHHAYVEYVGFTGPYGSVFGSDTEKVAHWDALYPAACAESNGHVELINEGDHPANSDIPFALLARPPPTCLAAHGSGTQDADPIEPTWGYVTWHPGGNEWQRKPGHGAWEIALRYDAAVVVNEMVRAPDQENDPTHFFDAGASCKLFGIVCTLHSIHGKAGQLWDADELAAARALKRGVQSIPATCQLGQYLHPNDGAFLRVYEMTGVGPGCRVEIRH